MNARYHLVFGALLSILAPSLVAAQEGGTVTGRVLDRTTLEPLPSVQIFVVGTEIGTLTNDDGRFLLTNVPAGSIQVSAVLIGYAEATQNTSVPPGASVTVDFTLRQSALPLEEVVVTGTAGEQLRVEQPAQVATVDASQVVATLPVQSVSDVLQSRVPGITILSGSGNSGGMEQIRIRGSSSISLSNAPLIFIDGVRIMGGGQRIGTPGSGAGSGGDAGGDATSRLNDLNPAAIERIEVVKGPAAATLYGADASGGVINIITKRGAAGGFTQTVAVEYNDIDPNWTPPANWAVCTESDIESGVPICEGLAPGTLVSDNPMVRENVLQHGQMTNLSWTGQGGVEQFRYFFSASGSLEDGTIDDNSYDRGSARANFTWTPHPDVVVQGGYGFFTTETQLVDQNHSLYGVMANALLGSPLTVGVEPQNGWLATRDLEAISAIDNSIFTLRHIPSLRVSVNPVEGFTNRLVVGGDFLGSESLRHYPRNDFNWYRGIHNSGEVRVTRRNLRTLTLDYLGNVEEEIGPIDANLAFGIQVISEKEDAVWAVGTGLATNEARTVSAAAERSGGQRITQERSIGYIGQFQVGYGDRIYLQVGLRADQNSSFGEDVGTIYLPKAGISYQLSRESFFQSAFPFLDEFRLRAAYGVTGRAPDPGAPLRTYEPAPFVSPSGQISVGVQLENPGNPELRPERGTELEVGADVSLLDDRLGIQLTYFDKVTKDLLLERPLPLSVGYVDNPWVNLGEVRNRGVEATINAQVLTSDELAWDITLGLYTLDNELRDLGGLPPFGTFTRYVEGRPLASYFSQVVKRVDVERGVAIVSDTLEYVGSQLPSFEGSLMSTLNLFQRFRLSAMLDARTGFKVDNGTAQYRQTQLVRSRVALDPNYFSSEEERLRHLGPFETESGEPVSRGEVREPYFEDGDFLRLREVMLTYLVPDDVARGFGAERASISVGGRNVFTWTGYTGGDPESSTDFYFDEFALTNDFLNIPPVRRWVAKLQVTF